MANVSPLDGRVRNVFNASVGVKGGIDLPLQEVAAYVDMLAGDDSSRIVFLSFREGRTGQAGDFEMLLITDRFATVQVFGRENDEGSEFYIFGDLIPLSAIHSFGIGRNSGAVWSFRGFVESISPELNLVFGSERVQIGGSSGFPIVTHSNDVPVETIRGELLAVLLNAYAPRD